MQYFVCFLYPQVVHIQTMGEVGN